MNFTLLLLISLALELAGAVPAFIHARKIIPDSIEVNDSNPSFNESNFSDVPKNESGTNGIEISNFSSYNRAYRPGAALWPNGIVIYEIDMSINSIDKQNKIHTGMKTISEATCVQWVRRTMENSDEPYIAFYKTTLFGEDQCSSQVGFGNQWPQRITQGNCEDYPDNAAGSAVHEAMHAMGFLHEFQRPDRDSYLKFTGNAGDAVNYGVKQGETRSIPFNFNSIMHYDPSLGFQEVNPRKPGVQKPLGDFKNMGQECMISKGDRNLVDRTYVWECKKRDPSFVLTEHTGPVMIEGTNCNMKNQADSDEGKIN